MTREDIVRMAQEAGIMPPNWGATENQWRSLEEFAKLVAKHEREACADIADRLPRIYRETEQAHYRLSPEPFKPAQFGFSFVELKQAEKITHAIRARGQA